MSTEGLIKDLQQKLGTHFALSKTDEIIREGLFENNSSVYSGIYLFFSFDLVNSTAFKSGYTDKWPIVFTSFYELIRTELQAKFEHISLWKYIGDEILLYLKVNDLEQIYDSPLFVLDAIENVTQELYKRVPESRKHIFIKSTLWIADIHYPRPSDSNTKVPESSIKNILYLSERNPHWLSDGQNIDFLGPDIDLGFRLSKHVEKSKLVLSAELAYILNRKSGEINAYQRGHKQYDVNQYIKIIDFKNLKGIWRNRPYPVIWFSKDFAPHSFEYDEQINSTLVKRIIENKAKPISDIGKIIHDVDKTDELEKVIKDIELNSKDQVVIPPTYNVSRERLAEIHCAAICFNYEGKMLMAKRRHDKPVLGGKWEFGCGQLEINQTIKDCLRKNYMKDFNANLEFPNDELIPITTYNFKIEEENRIVPGILFLTLIKDTSNLINNKHDEIQFVSEEELLSIPINDCVGDFHKSARLAYRSFSANYNPPLEP